jgi:DNA-binding NtrC family response regulator
MAAAAAPSGNILIADDQDDIRASLAMVLRAENYATAGAASPAELLMLLERGGFDALVLDLNFRTDTTSGAEGMALLSRLVAQYPTLPIVVLTGWGTIELAIRALRTGAADFVEKPWENARLISVLRTQLALAAAHRTAAALAAPALGGDLLYRSPAMAQVMAKGQKIAAADVTVLITGQSGTGKGALARAIAAASPRAATFIHADLGAIPETLIESTLFGHVRGAVTDAKADRPGQFELAHRGTLFLDEIGNASAAVRSRLLMAIEAGQVTRVGESRPRKVDVRIIAATNADIASRIAAGHFRSDLYFRLNTVEIALPALADRPEDILHLAEHFLKQHARRLGRALHTFAPAASAALLEYHWPGNIRELTHVVERAVLFAEHDEIRLTDLHLPATAVAPLEAMTLEQAERFLIQQALRACNDDAEAAARRLGLSRSAFYRRLNRLKL